MKQQWPLGDKELRIGILGMTEGNGHPYSWSAMYNDYDRTFMDQCPFAGIPVYLNKQPKHTIGIPGAHITHVCCDQRSDAEDVARCSLIPTVVDRPEDMIGQVDAVICATDIGSEHVERCRPFMEAGIPMFIDKPMVDNEADLRTFVAWRDAGKHFISSSSMRYVKSLEPFYKNHYELGKLMYICQPMAKKWETYGIHSLEAIYPITGPGFVSLANTGSERRNIVHLKHRDGYDVLLTGIYDYGNLGGLFIGGTKRTAKIEIGDSYHSFRSQLVAFINFLRTGERPFPWQETVELMKLVIAGIKSRELHGQEILIQ